MNKIAVIFPGKNGLTEPEDAWRDEYNACTSRNLFDPVFFDEEALIEDRSFKISRPAQIKKQYCFFRSSIDKPFNDDIFFHALKREGYYPVFSDLFECKGPSAYLSWDKKKSSLFPQRVDPFYRYGSEVALVAELLIGSSEQPPESPFVAKNNRRVLRNEDSSIHQFTRLLDDLDHEQILEMLCTDGIEKYRGTGAWRESSVWYEEHLDIQTLDGYPIEWRVSFYRNRVLYKSPKYGAPHVITMPELPEEILDLIKTDCSIALDLAMISDGSWKILKVQRGEQAKVPLGGGPTEFYDALEYGLTHEPEIPGWAWCPVGRIVKSHSFGEKHVKVIGSKDFAAGTKVYMVDAFWGMGAERCLVLGVPKYSNKIIGTIIKTSLIRDWALERVTDKAVLRAMFTNRLTEDFERPRETGLYGYWGQTDEEKKAIHSFVDSANWQRKERDDS